MVEKESNEITAISATKFDSNDYSEVFSIGSQISPIDSLDNAIITIDHIKSELKKLKHTSNNSELEIIKSFELAESYIKTARSFLLKSEYAKLSSEVDSLNTQIVELKKQNEDLEKKIETLNKETQTLISKNLNLTKEIDNLKSDNYNLSNELGKVTMTLNTLVENEAKKTSLMLIFDLITLYRFYVVNNIFDWNQFTDDVHGWMDDIKDKTKEQADFDEWLATYATILQGVDVLELIEKSRNSHCLAHTAISSVTDQKDFIEYCENFNFTGDDVKRLASQLLPILKQQKLKRKK